MHTPRRVLPPARLAFRHRCAGALLMCATVLIAACRSAERTPSAPAGGVLVRVSRNTISAPDTVAAGWTRVRVEERDGGHIVVLFRLPATSSRAEIATFVTALDTVPTTPLPGVAIGGPEVGEEGEIIANLTAGVYVLGCVRRGDDGHRHVSTGESHVLRVRAASTADSVASTTPASTHTVRMVDFAFVGPDEWTAGAQLLRIENTGVQDHQLRLNRLHDGVSLEAWLNADDQNAVSTAVVGMARVGAGEVAYLPVSLTPGNYVAYCLIPDQKSGQMHVERGMFRAIKVP